jgi:hypothetical protein
MRKPLVVTVLLALAACGEDSTVGQPDEQVSLPFPSQWADTIDNPWLPLTPGTRWVYDSTSEEGNQRIVVTVMDDKRSVNGVDATVVRDVVSGENGEVLEDTYDWYAQDLEGNVWYLGEDTKSYDEGTVSTEGSWEAGVDGAEAGIVMLADPQPGDEYRQEYYAGVAEDEGRVLRLDASVRVPYGAYTGVLQTEDLNPLEPDVVENKWYARGVGVVQERDVAGGDEHVVLVKVERP